MLRELLDVSVGTAEGLAEVSGVPTLGTIALDPDIKSRPLVVGDVAYSPRAEAMRQLRTNLQFIDAAHPARTVVVTSTRDGEGKSTVSVNLALVVAETGRRVLLIGADLRRPRIGELLGIEGGVGLSNLLAGQRELDEVLQPWGDSGLVVLPCGPIPPNPSELLGGPRMSQLLATCAERFDLVIIDTPPLRPVTDAAVVAANADGAIVVFWHGHTKRNHLQAAVHALNAVNSRVLGCVLNMKPLSRAERRGYATYYDTGKKRWAPVLAAGGGERPGGARGARSPRSDRCGRRRRPGSTARHRRSSSNRPMPRRSPRCSRRGRRATAGLPRACASPDAQRGAGRVDGRDDRPDRRLDVAQAAAQHPVRPADGVRDVVRPRRHRLQVGPGGVRGRDQVRPGRHTPGLAHGRGQPGELTQQVDPGQRARVEFGDHPPVLLGGHQDEVGGVEWPRRRRGASSSPG